MKRDTQFYGFVKLAYAYRKGLGNADKITSDFIGNGTDFTIKKEHLNAATTGYPIRLKSSSSQTHI